jgi:hypothetical protein
MTDERQVSWESCCATAGGAGEVSVATLATGAPAPGVRSVHVRAFAQFARAVVAAAPERGTGSSSSINAGRQVTLSMWRPVAVITSEPL